MYKAIVTVDGKKTVEVEGATPALLGAAIGGAITADPLGGAVDVVYEVSGPLSRKAVISDLVLVSVEPDDEDTDVELDAAVVVTFNNPIKANKITVATEAGVNVAGSKTWDAARKVLTFTPYSALNGDTTYVVSIEGVVDVYNQELDDATSEFTTKPDALALVSIVPADEAVDVALGTTVVITFSNEIKAEDISVIHGENVAVAGAKAWDAAKKVLTFTPAEALAGGIIYTVDISGVADIYDQTLAATSTEFTTVTG